MKSHQGAEEDSYLVRAIHPHWESHLKIYRNRNEVIHVNHARSGIYEIAENGEHLFIHIHGFKRNKFIKCGETYVHEQLVLGAPEIQDLIAVRFGQKFLTVRNISLDIPGANYPVSVRVRSSDIPTFDQIFIANEYNSPNLPKIARNIVDLGANIGLATVFFALRYPDAKILSVEPEGENFSLMEANTRALGARIRREQAAAWVNDGHLNLHTEDKDGTSLGAWGVQVSEHSSQKSRKTQCFRIGTLLDRAGMDHVDLLKVDIEGAELEIFSDQYLDWLERIEMIVVETHDRFRVGSDHAVRSALQRSFTELPRCGENLIFARTRR